MESQPSLAPNSLLLKAPNREADSQKLSSHTSPSRPACRVDDDADQVSPSRRRIITVLDDDTAGNGGNKKEEEEDSKRGLNDGELTTETGNEAEQKLSENEASAAAAARRNQQVETTRGHAQVTAGDRFVAHECENEQQEHKEKDAKKSRSRSPLCDGDATSVPCRRMKKKQKPNANAVNATTAGPDGELATSDVPLQDASCVHVVTRRSQRPARKSVNSRDETTTCTPQQQQQESDAPHTSVDSAVGWSVSPTDGAGAAFSTDDVTSVDKEHCAVESAPKLTVRLRRSVGLTVRLRRNAFGEYSVRGGPTATTSDVSVVGSGNPRRRTRSQSHPTETNAADQELACEGQARCPKCRSVMDVELMNAHLDECVEVSLCITTTSSSVLRSSFPSVNMWTHSL